MKLIFLNAVVSLVTVVVGLQSLNNERSDVVSQLSNRSQQPVLPNSVDSNVAPWPKRSIEDTDEPCINHNRRCTSWVKIGECQNKPEYMLANCKQACGACDMEYACVNTNRNCNRWARKGACHIYPYYMLFYCKEACNTCVSTGNTEYQAVEHGNLFSLNFRIFIIKKGLGPVSPFHDIPLFANEVNNIFNMVVEIPRWTNAKMEIDTKDDLNAIKQDTKDGNLRYIANCFPYKGYIWNYGALPQTWEDPNRIDHSTGQKGDNDPIDVCEIGYRVAKRGEVLQVKVLGVLALIDEGETDWKLIVIDINDPLAPQLNDIDDLEEHMPGFIDATVDWFRIYKVPSGKPENQFAFNGEPKNREFAHEVILETHEHWKDLIEGRSDPGGLSTKSVIVTNAVNKITFTDAKAIRDAAPQLGQPLLLDPELDIWHYCR